MGARMENLALVLEKVERVFVKVIMKASKDTLFDPGLKERLQELTDVDFERDLVDLSKLNCARCLLSLWRTRLVHVPWTSDVSHHYIFIGCWGDNIRWRRSRKRC